MGKPQCGGVVSNRHRDSAIQTIRDVIPDLLRGGGIRLGAIQ